MQKHRGSDYPKKSTKAGQSTKPAGSKAGDYGKKASTSAGGYKKPYEKYGKRTGQFEKPYEQKTKQTEQSPKPHENRQFSPQRFEAPIKQQLMQSKPKSMPEPQKPELGEDTLPYFLMGRNAVREALKRGRSIDRILVVPEQDGSLREIIGLAASRRIVVAETMRKRLDELCMPFGHGGRPGNHQGILAFVPEVEYSTLEDNLEYAKECGEPPFLLLLDEINDPYNLGSILRSAACAGVHGVVLPKRRAASVTAAVAKASAGAVEYVKVAKVSNITAAIETLKKAGIWIAGAEMAGEPMHKANLKGPIGIVIGNEAKGLSRLVANSCDFLVSIPMSGQMDSLNAAVAAALVMFEKNRQEADG